MENSMSQIELPLCSFDSLSQMMHIHAYTLGFAWVDAEFHHITTQVTYKLGHYCVLRLLIWLIRIADKQAPSLLAAREESAGGRSLGRRHEEQAQD